MKNYIQNLFNEFKKNKNISLNFSPQVTPRVNVILSFLEENKIEYVLDEWKIKGRCLHNVYVKFESATTEYRLFDAHHDVANYKSENAQDNTCSVINLLLLAKELKEIPIDNSIIIAFTDGEEIKIGGAGSGATRAAEYFKKSDLEIYSSYALELSGLGDIIWHNSNRFKLDNSELLSCPFNNSTIYDAFFPSTCIGILPKQEIETGKLKTWMLCHRKEDTFDKCEITDMEKFIYFLYFLASSDMIEVENYEDPFYRLVSLGLMIKKNYTNKVKINISTDISTQEVELLILPSYKDPLFTHGYFKITYEGDFFIQAWNSSTNTVAKSAADIVKILNRTANIK